MRLGSLAVSKALLDQGLTPIYQLTCRDRNRIALQSDLLSAAMFGIENLLLLTGDHTRLGDHPQAKPVFDLDSVSLLHAVTRLEAGEDLGGNPLVGEPPKFAKGRGGLPLQRFRGRPAGQDGAEGARQARSISRPRRSLSRRSSSRFMEKAKQFGKPVQVGIIIPKSAGMARNL